LLIVALVLDYYVVLSRCSNTVDTHDHHQVKADVPVVGYYTWRIETSTCSQCSR